jgi:hypothetical protein
LGRVINHDRRSKLIDGDADETNNRVGYWSREQLIKMDEKFCRAMRKAHPERENPSQDEEAA